MNNKRKKYMFKCVATRFALLARYSFVRRGVCIIPHDSKVEKGGEDAFLALDHALAIADGVGGWANVGVDPALFARHLMKECHALAKPDEQIRQHNIYSILEHGASRLAEEKPTRGSCTACGVSLSLREKKEGTERVEGEEGMLYLFNLGDSGAIVVRGESIIAATKEQQHKFNCPFQLSSDGSDKISDGDLQTLPVQKGDLVMVTTDGVLDNLREEDIRQILTAGISTRRSCDGMALAVARSAYDNSKNKTYFSPFAERARANGYFYRGGKPDDISVLVGLIGCGEVRERCPELITDM